MQEHTRGPRKRGSSAAALRFSKGAAIVSATRLLLLSRRGEGKTKEWRGAFQLIRCCNFGRGFESQASVVSASPLPRRQATISRPIAIERTSTGAKVCLLFPGQGSQQVNMLRDLVTSRRSSHALFDRADDLLSNSISQPLSSYIFPPPALSKAEQDSEKSDLNNTRIAQPALAVVELAAYDLLHEFGLRPHFLAGHSFGEYVAALHSWSDVTR